MYYVGWDDESINGVTFIVPPQINKYVIMILKSNSKPLTLNIVQLYAPTATLPIENIDDFYVKLEVKIKSSPNRELLILIGEWNTKVGGTTDNDHTRNAVGKYGLACRDEKGDLFWDFCLSNNLSV